MFILCTYVCESFTTLLNKMQILINTMFVFALLILQHTILITYGQYGFEPKRRIMKSRSLATDKTALLEFKRGITDDPFSTLANWNHSVHVCRFNGVRCSLRGPHRVRQIVLRETDLLGPLSPSISNLTSLRFLWISQARLFGNIPSELSSLRRLRYIFLNGNNLQGQIPLSLFLLPNLKSLVLLDNKLSCTLRPEYFKNCSVLQIIDFSENDCSGEVPAEIGNCRNLWSLNLYNNRFTGVLPLSLSNLTNIKNLDVEYNGFEGEIPTKIVRNLPKLVFLHLSYNNMKSHNGNNNLEPFFDALKNCTHLEEIELAGMELGGRLPDSIGRLGINLSSILLQENRITGGIPSSIFSLSMLRMLNLTSNHLNETISTAIGVLPRLEQLFLSHNNFCGPIPQVFGEFRHLGLLDLSHNNFSGEIPKSLGNLSRLNYLFLNHNRLSGTIPLSLQRCSELHKLDLSYNRLTGIIPPQISGMSQIKIFINLSHNRLEGPLPAELSKMKDVQEIDLSSNSLNGTIFPQISSCIAALVINLAHNSLQGKLPDSIGDLHYLQSLDVSGNNLSGKIPTTLRNISTLKYLNLSFNNFEDEIPHGGIFDSVTNFSFSGNPHLCGNFSQSVCAHKKIHDKGSLFHRLRIFTMDFVVIAVLLALLLVICFAYFCGWIEVISIEKDKSLLEPISPEFLRKFPRITYRELSAATEDFNEMRLIGSGSYGRVYKGDLSNGKVVAVKVSHSQSSKSKKSFFRECRVMRMIRHRNLMKIITVYCVPDFNALIFPYMENGSLESRLYGFSPSALAENVGRLSLAERVKICRDVAEGMAYLHHHCPAAVVHCDLKPSNVLLNGDMSASVSDFGIARVVRRENERVEIEDIGSLNTNSDMLVGSIGYIPPEYGLGSRTSTKGDVYSFGILVLEMVTGKRPTDDMFVGGLTLHNWVKSHRHGRNIDKVVDSCLVRASENAMSTRSKRTYEVTFGALIGLGILCTQDSPSSRPTMLDVAIALNHLETCLRWAR